MAKPTTKADSKLILPAVDKMDSGQPTNVHPGKIYRQMSIEEKRQLPNQALMQMWLNERVEVNHIESTSYESYCWWAHSLLKYLTQTNLKIIDLTATDVLTYKNYLEGRNTAKGTILNYFKALRGILTLLHEMGVKEYDWPAIVRFKRHRKTDQYRTPTPVQVFAVRRKEHIRIRDIVMFEMLLSTGARFGDLMQLRGSDITFGSTIRDLELNQLSPYVGGYVTILPKRARIKTQRAKVLYFSTAAAKWLRQWMTLMNTDKHPHLPLFACHRNNAARWFYTLGHGIFSNLALDAKLINNKMDTMERKPGFGDINVDDLKDVPANIRKMIRTSQNADAVRRSQHELLDKLETLQYADGKKDVLHMHAMRHFFAGAMLHRTYDGDRDNIRKVQKLLHHSSLLQTEKYLRKAQFPISDQQWKTIMLGRVTDWPNAVISLKRNNSKAKIMFRGQKPHGK